MSTSRTLHHNASFAAAVVAASLALSGIMAGATASDRAHLGTDHLAQSIGQTVGLSAAAISQITGAQFDIGAVAGLRHEQAAQYYIDHALELLQNS